MRSFRYSLALFLAATLAIPSMLHASESGDLAAAKAHYLTQASAAESARVVYLHELIKSHDTLVALEFTPAWNKEVKARLASIMDATAKLPEPEYESSLSVAHRLVGNWHTAHHDTHYSSNGNWKSWPLDQSSSSQAAPAHGVWYILGNKLIETQGEQVFIYTILLLDAHDLVCVNQDGAVFFAKRGTK